jgi:hypothetical protein
MMMQLGADGVFVGSGIFKSGNPEQRAAGDRRGDHHFEDPEVIAKVSRNLGEAMVGIEISRCRRSEVRLPRLVSQPASTPRLDPRWTPGGAVDRPGLPDPESTAAAPTIGVLALQGDVLEHLRALRRCGADAVQVRTTADLAPSTGWSCRAASRPPSASC